MFFLVLNLYVMYNYSRLDGNYEKSKIITNKYV